MFGERKTSGHSYTNYNLDSLNWIMKSGVCEFYFVSCPSVGDSGNVRIYFWEQTKYMIASAVSPGKPLGGVYMHSSNVTIDPFQHLICETPCKQETHIVIAK